MQKLIIAAHIFMFALFGSASLAAAQQAVQDGTTMQPPTDQNMDRTAGTTRDTTQTRDDGFNWMWLLPLLAIPVILMMRRDKKDDDRSDYRDQRFAGTKGGEARRNRDEMNN